MTSLLEDLRYAMRMLTRAPGFTALAVLTLGLGIGANTALFSVVNGVLLNPLPFPHPEELITFHESKPNFDTGSVSYLNFLDWQNDNHTLSAMALARGYSFSLTGLGEAEGVSAQFVTADFFPVLGVKPVAGRLFERGDDRRGAAPVALISGGLWKRKFGAGPDVVGKTLTLDGRGYRIVGIIPSNFELLLGSFRPSEVYVPLVQWNNNLLFERAAGLGTHGVARLKPGVTIDQARADLAEVTRNLAAAYPESDKGIGATLIPFRTAVVGRVEPFLRVLLAAVGFVLLIACVNVANLLLARSTSRSREFAVRAALGAGKLRLIRQLLTESILLAVWGGILGLLFASWGTSAALGHLPATLPRASEVRIDPRVLLFTAAMTLFAGVAFGLGPALTISRRNLQDTLKESGRGSSSSRHRAQGVLVVAEMALALILVTGAGLMLRTLFGLWNVDPGFNSRNVVSFGFSLPPSMLGASPAAIRAAFRNVGAAIASTPAVQAVSMSWGAFPMDGDDEWLFWMEGQPKPVNQSGMKWALDYVVDPGYLKVMGTPLRRGRFFTARDDENAPPVVLVDEVFARQYFQGNNPVGRRLHIENLDGRAAEIIGVVAHVKQWGLSADDTAPLRAQLYFPFMQLPDEIMALAPTGMRVVVRSQGWRTGTLDSIRRSLERMNTGQVVYGAQTMGQIISTSLESQRFSMILLGAFAGLALLLSSIGIYGVIAYLVGQQTREIGIRVAFGADRRDILYLILGQGAKLALLGVAVGISGGLGLTRLMRNLLYGVAASDPFTFAAVALVVTFVALVACYIPARRAMRVDPLVALRYE
jgi:predicted permease